MIEMGKKKKKGVCLFLAVVQPVSPDCKKNGGGSLSIEEGRF